MDIATQALLGAATFTVALNKDLGKKTMLIGAALGIIPDLDTLCVFFYDEISILGIHRGLTHSLLFSLLLAAAFAWAAKRYYPIEISRNRWFWAFFVALFTHPVLDTFTVFGTQLLFPFTNHLFSTYSIHILEPIYTGLLLFGCLVWYLGASANYSIRQRTLQWTLALSTFYLGWTLVSRQIALSHFQTHLSDKGIASNKAIASPTPFNTLLWACTAECDSGYYFQRYSLLDGEQIDSLYFVKSDNQYIGELKSSSRLKTYLHYTDGFPLLRHRGDSLMVFAIKYGAVNYQGAPKYVYPLVIHSKKPPYIRHEPNFKGPFNDFEILLGRIRGMNN